MPKIQTKKKNKTKSKNVLKCSFTETFISLILHDVCFIVHVNSIISHRVIKNSVVHSYCETHHFSYADLQTGIA